ncbi:hypothetical protein [Pseudoroseicyclus tamaricis]|uniref:Dihydroorotate dehydrogenase n=1 Tax=Pseudoroseicyclus tamaricis TaxID=2705421 RepID=A0A6B2JNY7_9RHOB|nr:hypothetical protein [Pseudoroseicyclus tamaricis]NDV00417.1 hypothetical protein [Pseudoroseicyclus tamaricis]
MTEQTDDDLEDLFGAAREGAPAPSAAFMARLQADARGAQPRPRPAVAMAMQPAMAGGGTMDAGGGFSDELGGWPSLTFLVLVALTGLWFGVAAPGSIGHALSTLFGGGVTIELVPSADVFGSEGL